MESQTKIITFNRLPILGNSKVSFDEWKFSFDHWCKTFKVTEESEKVDYLFAVTDKTARTIVYNSLNKKNPDSYDTILSNLGKHFKRSTSKNSRILELSSITIKKDESISDFDLRFSELLNLVNKTVNVSEVITTSYYINAFRNWPRIYESLMEEEPTTLEEAMKITTKKEKILNLLKENKENKERGSSSNSKGKSTNNNKKQESYQNTSYNKNPTRYVQQINNNSRYTQQINNNSRYAQQNDNNNGNLDKYSNYYNNQNRNYSNYNNYNRQYTNEYKNQKQPNEIHNNYKNKLNDNEMDELTKKLSELKINFCVNCLGVGHDKGDCPEEETQEMNEKHLN